MSETTLLLILRILDLLALGLKLAPELQARYNRLTGRLKLMVQEGRNPTEQEFAEILDETDDLSKRIQES